MDLETPILSQYGWNTKVNKQSVKSTTFSNFNTVPMTNYKRSNIRICDQKGHSLINLYTTFSKFQKAC